MLVKEIVYACLDLAKAATSDDSFLNEEHCLFLCKKYRSLLIKKERDREKEASTVASEFEQQEICLTLEKVSGENCVSGAKIRTVEKLPKLMDGSSIKVYPVDYFSNVNISFVSKDKMKYTGNNPYLQNVIYASLAPDFHLYLNSSNKQFMYLERIRVNASFEDFEEAARLACDSDGTPTPCDIFSDDVEFPIREYLVPTLIEMVVKELVGAAYRPVDSSNDAADNLAELVNFIRRNTKSALQKQIED